MEQIYEIAGDVSIAMIMVLFAPHRTTGWAWTAVTSKLCHVAIGGAVSSRIRGGNV